MEVPPYPQNTRTSSLGKENQAGFYLWVTTMINILTNKFGFEIANLTVITNKSVTVIPAQKQLYIKYWVWLYTWALIQSNYCKNLAKNLLSLIIIAHKWPQMQEPISPGFRNRRFFGYVSGKLPTYPSLKPTLTLTSHLGQNVGLGEG